MKKKKSLSPEQELLLTAIDTVKDKYMELNDGISIEFLFELANLRTKVVTGLQ